MEPRSKRFGGWSEKEEAVSNSPCRRTTADITVLQFLLVSCALISLFPAYSLSPKVRPGCR